MDPEARSVQGTSVLVCAWVCSHGLPPAAESWGGGIELSILSRHYHREIAAFDIRSNRVDVFGEDQG